MEKEVKQRQENAKLDGTSCNDELCPFHGNLSLRGRRLEGFVTKKFQKRVVVEYERVVKVKKYERYLKKNIKLHARVPECLRKEIEIGDYVEVKESRPLSKIINFVVTKKIYGEDKK